MAEVEGADRLKEKILKLSPAIRKAVEAAVLQGAQDVAATARRLVPVDTGKLRESIGATLGEAPSTKATQALRGGRSKSSKEEGAIIATVYAGNDEAFYAGFVEFGTRPSTAGERVESKGAKQSKSGRVARRTHPGTTAAPFFFPAFRANKKRAKSRISRAISKAIKEALKG